MPEVEGEQTEDQVEQEGQEEQTEEPVSSLGDEPSEEEELEELFNEADETAEDEDEEDATNPDVPIAGDDDYEEEEEEEEARPIELLAESFDDEEEEEEEGLIPEGTLDKEIQDQMWLVKDYADWMQAGEAAGVPVETSFAAMVAKSETDPQFLADRGIYSIDQYNELVEDLESKTSPDAVVLPDSDDKDAILDFDFEHRDIPRVPDEYRQEVFKGTHLEDDIEGQVEARLVGMDLGLSNTQLSGVLERLELERDIAEEENQLKLKEFVQAQEELMVEEYGDDLMETIKNVNKVLRDYGRPFADKFKGDKALKSKEFVDMMQNIIEAGLDKKRIDLTDVRLKLTGISSKKLTEYESKIQGDLDEAERKKDRSPKDKKRFDVLYNRFTAVHHEMGRRNLN